MYVTLYQRKKQSHFCTIVLALEANLIIHQFYIKGTRSCCVYSEFYFGQLAHFSNSYPWGVFVIYQSKTICARVYPVYCVYSITLRIRHTYSWGDTVGCTNIEQIVFTSSVLRKFIFCCGPVKEKFTFDVLKR